LNRCYPCSGLFLSAAKQVQSSRSAHGYGCRVHLELASAILEVASSTICLKSNIKQPWMTESTFNVLEKKPCDRWLVQERSMLQTIFNARLNWTARRTTTDWLMKHRKESTRTICAQHCAGHFESVLNSPSATMCPELVTFAYRHSCCYQMWSWLLGATFLA